MASLDANLIQMLAAPRESLDLELKQWISPKSPEGIAKIAKGCIALRNNNGGRLVIGFKDDGTRDTAGMPGDVRAAFHVDEIQAIVSKYSAELFQIDVQFVELGGEDFPVISVPPGVRSPVAAKSNLDGTEKNKPLIRDHAVYVRSLSSNGIVSSSEARRGDWETLTRICFDNREADIGGFVRRHLAALNLETLSALMPLLAPAKPDPTALQRAVAEMDRGRARFNMVVKQRKLKIPALGLQETAILIEGDFPKPNMDASFRHRLLAGAPRHTGWPPYVDLSVSEDESPRPYVFEGGWEAMIDLLDPKKAMLPRKLNFWRIEPRGVFYLLRAMEDDLAGSNGPEPGTQLDFLLQVSRTAEVISTGLFFARSLGCDETKSSVTFGFRWSGLAGRHLSSWVERQRSVWSRSPAQQDEFVKAVTVPLETPPAGIAPHVENVVRDLFVLFDGESFVSQVIEAIVKNTVEQRY